MVPRKAVARAGAMGLPLAVAIIGGDYARSRPSSTSIVRRARRSGHDPKTLKTSINVHGFIADTTDKAADQFYGPQAAVMDRLGRERGWPPTNRAQFDRARSAPAISSSAIRRRWLKRSLLPTRSSATIVC